MKKLFFVSALAAISLVSCKKEIVNSPVTEGANVVATKVGSFKTEEDAPKLWFTGNFKQLMMALPGNGRGICQFGRCYSSEYTFKLTNSSGSTITSKLKRLGNSNNYRSDNLNMFNGGNFMLCDFVATDMDGVELYSGQIFIYESGQTAEQNPKVADIEKLGQWTHSSGIELIETLVVTISGDPAQQIDKLRFIPDPIRVETGDPRNPFKTIQLPSFDLEKTHYSQTTGIARFSSMNYIKSLYIDSFEYTISDGELVSGSIYFMNKGDLIDKIAEKAGLKKADAAQ